VRQEVRVEAFSGPLPPPDTLIRYNDAFPGCAERIVKMAESQTQHRQALETRALNGKLANERVGQWMAFVLAALGIGGAIWLMSIDRFGAGATVFGTIVGSVVATIIWGRVQQRRQLEDKARAFGPRDMPSAP
jgi:uncharacterized membrane protein